MQAWYGHIGMPPCRHQADTKLNGWDVEWLEPEEEEDIAAARKLLGAGVFGIWVCEIVQFERSEVNRGEDWAGPTALGHYVGVC